MIPYYTGFISHDAAGSLSSFKPWTLAPSDYLEMISRLGVNKPNFMTAAYFLGSTVLFFIAGIASLIASVWFLWQGNAGRGDSPRISVRSSAFRRALNRGFL